MPIDILLNENFELQIAEGDFVSGESTYEHQRTLLLADKGEIKLFPKNGVGVRRYLEHEAPDELAREIRQEFYADGMTVNEIKIGEDLEINIDADYGD
ncbi:hypothetical protein SAMN05443633_107150 [Chryseobacterium arachidis]|uniref:Uncharacterized protein n=1 Tax=Chryseobacterium arachidis TaxID=1416778 RepID=A0A1M5F4C5_9FLAO|nr:hypothetical protein [Chryseobacterium arachidis]SHF85942.1 hypothetical protein SAMN05443633_107150 [Chryseobacterium arachidis]